MLKTIAIRALVATEMADLPFGAILSFYQKPEDEYAAETFVQDIDS